jgi:hypothetical protein
MQDDDMAARRTHPLQWVIILGRIHASDIWMHPVITTLCYFLIIMIEIGTYLFNQIHQNYQNVN